MPDVIIPVLDEAGALPGLLTAFPPGYRPIVVDNGSRDGSAAVARAHGAVVVSEPRRGFGAACFAGLMASDPGDGVVCFIDGDGSLDPADLENMTAVLRDPGADLVLGARRPISTGAWPVHARAGNAALAWRLRHRTGVRLHDIGPMRAARRASLVALGIEDRRFGWPLEMVLRAANSGWRIIEVPVAYRPRIGRSKVTGTVRGTARAIRDMDRVIRALS
jgi:glycosyltransferase involved in cell wall biosynthesis